MDDGIDIYEDLPNFNTNDIDNSCTKANEICGKCDELTKQVNDLTEKIKKVEKENEILEVNLASLLKTAKAEVARKDRMIADLREQLDNALFRRVRNHPKSTPYPQPTVKNGSNMQSTRGKYPIQRSQHSAQRIPPTENEITSTDNEYDTAIEEEYIEKKEVEAQKKLQDTVYGKRLRKRIMEKEYEEARAAKTIGISIVESNKENATVNKINTDTEASIPAVEYCTVENKQDNDLKHNIDNKVDHVNTPNIPVDKISSTCPVAKASLEVCGKRSNEDVTNLPSSKRRKKNEEQPFDTEISNMVDITRGSNFEYSKHTYQQLQGHDKHDRKKCEGKYSEDEMCQNQESKSKYVPEGIGVESHYENNERRHHSRRDSEDKRDNYRHKSIDYHLNSRSRERSREKNNYHDVSRESSSHYEHDKGYQQYSRSSERKYTHKPYERHYSNDRRTFKSNSRKPDNFKEKDSSSCKTFRRNSYDLRDKVENRYEKKSDYIYYESNKYKRDRYGTEFSRNRRSLSEIKEEKVSSKSYKKSVEKVKREVEKIIKPKSKTVQNNTADKVKNATQSENVLEDGEVIDTEKSAPIQNSPTNQETYCDEIKVKKEDPPSIYQLETAVGRETCAKLYKTHKVINAIHTIPKISEKKANISTPMREEVIENIEQFIQNYNEQEFSNQVSNTGKHLNTGSVNYNSDSIENVVDILTMDDTLNQSEKIKIENENSEDMAADDKNIAHSDQIARAFDTKYQSNAEELVRQRETPIVNETADTCANEAYSLTCKLPNTVEEDSKNDITKRDFPNADKCPKSSGDHNAVYKGECGDNAQNIDTVNVDNVVHTIKQETMSESTVTDNRLIDNDDNHVKIEKSYSEESSLPKEEALTKEKVVAVTKKDNVNILAEDVALDFNKVDAPVESPKTSTTDLTSTTDKHALNSHKSGSLAVDFTNENKPNDNKDNKQIKAFQNICSKVNENKNNSNERVKVIVARRRRPVQLGDMNASMTIVMSQSVAKPTDNVNNTLESSNTLKPRACKISRTYKKNN